MAYNLSQVLANKHIDIYKVKTSHDTKHTTADGQEPSSLYLSVCGFNKNMTPPLKLLENESINN